MGIATLILVYVIVWWLVFFMALPFGSKPQHDSEDGIVLGTAPSAPEDPKLGIKAFWTSIISLALTVAYYFVATSGLISFDRGAP